MKKIYIIIYSVLLSFCIGGCTIEHEIYDKINPNIFPKNATEADALLMANVYNVLSANRIFSTGWSWQTFSSAVSIELHANNWAGTYIGFDNNSQSGYPFTAEDSRTIPYNYSSYLSKMLLTLERIKDVPMDNETKARMNAEIRCGMGFLAFLLYDLYGPVPLPGLEVLTNPLDDIFVPRASEEEMQQYIESNLLLALEGDHLPTAYPSSEYGRFTRGLAHMLLFKYYMMMGGFEMRDGKANGGGYWEKAMTHGLELIKAEYGYALVQNYSSLFSEDGERSSEVIFSSPCDLVQSFTNLWPPHVIPPDYPTPNQNLQKWGTFKFAWAFYDTFERNDKRIEEEVMINSHYTGTGGVEHSRQLDANSNGKVMYWGAVPLKYSYKTTVGQDCPVDIVIYRYADAITLLAEAAVRSGYAITQNVPGGKSPLDYMNDVRTRAGLVAYSAGDFSGTDDFLNKLLLERNHELWMEGHIRQDQIRYGVFIEQCMLKGRNAQLSDARIEHMARQTIPGRYDFERFPIPPSAVNQGMTQNPGY